MNVRAVNNHIKPALGAVHSQRAVSTSVVQLDKTKFGTNPDYVVVQCTGNTVRYTVDGVSPTSSTGFQLTAGTTAEWSVAWATAAKFIRESADATIEYVGACD